MQFLRSTFNFLARQFGGPAAAQGHAGHDVPAVIRTRPVRRVFIGWDAMLDEEARIVGYLLRPRATGQDGLDAEALGEALEAEKLAPLAQRLTVVVEMSVAQWRALRLVPLAAPKLLVLLADFEAVPAEQRGPLLAELRAAGVGLALPAVCATDPAVVAARPGMLVWDFQATPMQQLEASVRVLGNALPATLRFAQRVESWPERRLARALGFDFCSGGFASTPDKEAAGGRLGQSRLVVVELLNLMRKNADQVQIVAVAKRDPGVVVKLVEMANSPVYGLSRKVATLDEALLLVGREALHRWLALALFKVDGAREQDRTLLVLALSRADFLHALREQEDPREAEELFLLGLFSVLDALFEMPFAQILEKLRLAEPVATALLGGDSPYARYLVLLKAMERCELGPAMVLAAAMDLDPVRLVDAYGEAVHRAGAELLQP